MNDTQGEEISAFVREILPNAQMDELRDAQRCYENYLDILMRIYRRLDAEGHFSRPRDKRDQRDTLKGQQSNGS